MTLFPFKYYSQTDSNAIQGLLNDLQGFVGSNTYDRKYVQEKFIDPILTNLSKLDMKAEQHDNRFHTY